MVNIALPYANFEAYLKSVFTALLAAFACLPTLASLRESFIRTESSYGNVRELIARGDAEGLEAFLKELKA